MYVKISFKSHTWKWKIVCVKNVTYSFHEIWWNLSFFVPVKKMSSVKKYKNFAISLPWKRKSTREKILKYVRENFWVPLKIKQKVCVKANFPLVKQVKTRPKIAFTGTFDFHWKKNADTSLKCLVVDSKNDNNWYQFVPRITCPDYKYLGTLIVFC